MVFVYLEYPSPGVPRAKSLPYRPTYQVSPVRSHQASPALHYPTQQNQAIPSDPYRSQLYPSGSVESYSPHPYPASPVEPYPALPYPAGHVEPYHAQGEPYYAQGKPYHGEPYPQVHSLPPSTAYSYYSQQRAKYRMVGRP